MNKKVINFILLLLVSFTFTSKVNAISCSDIDIEIDKYYSYKEKLDKGICNETDNEKSVNECNDSNLQKNLIVSKLMKLDDEGATCRSNQNAVDNIIKENKDKCNKVLDDDFTNIVNNIMVIFYIIGPILLIVFGTIDYSKVVISSDKDSLKKANQRFFKRLIATILLFLSPAFTNLIISLNNSDYYLSGDAYVCNYSAVSYKKKYDIKYILQKISSGKYINNESYSSILEAADALHKEQMTWHYSQNFPPLTSGNIESAINNPNKGTCCATYVSSVLYKAGLFTEEEINSINYNHSVSLSNLLENSGWQKITNYSDLQAGDIVFMTSGSTRGVGHVQIYAGDGTWYNAGGNGSIRGEAPYSSDASRRFLYAMRQ